MYMRAIGWEVGKKDKIDLDWQKLRERQGLYSCPSITENKKPFYCCMEVQEEKIKVIAIHLSIDWCHAVQGLVFPYSIHLLLTESRQFLTEPEKRNITHAFRYSTVTALAWMPRHCGP